MNATPVPMADGTTMSLPMTSSQSWRALFTGRYDAEIIRMLADFVRPGSLVVDIGASVGLYTVPLAAAARRAGATVLAVEPMPRNTAFVQANVARNGLDSVVDVRCCALGARSGALEMHSEGGGVGNAAATAGVDAAEMGRHDRAGSQSHVETVPMLRLDDVLEGIARRVSLVKVDVEGFEFEVLAGAEAMVERDRPVLYTEMNPDWLASRGVPAGALDDWLRRHAYRAQEVATEHCDRWSDRRRIVLRDIDGDGDRRGGDLLLTPT